MTITKKISISFITRALSFITAFIISILISRNLGPELFGLYKYILLLISTSYLLSNLGVFESNNQLLASIRIDKNNAIVINLIWSIFIYLFIISFLAIYLSINKDSFLSGKILLLCVIYLLLYIQNFSISYILIGINKINEYNVLSCLKLIIILLIIIFKILLKNFSIEFLLFIQIIVSFFYSIIIFFILKPNLNLECFMKEINKNSIKDLFKRGIIIYFSNLSTFLNYRLDMFLLKIFSNFKNIGFYSIAVGLVERLWILPESIRNIVFLEIAGKRKDSEFMCIVTRITIFFVFVISLLLGLISFKLIPLFYSNAYIKAIVPFNLLLPGVVFFSFSKILASFFYGKDMIYVNTISSIVSFIINLILNIFLIPKYGIIGASISTTFSYLIGGIIHIFYFKNFTGNNLIDILLIKKSDFILIKSKIISMF